MNNSEAPTKLYYEDKLGHWDIIRPVGDRDIVIYRILNDGKRREKHIRCMSHKHADIIMLAMQKSINKGIQPKELS